MNAWKRICCPIDFSPISRLAMQDAVELGWRFGGDITLLHVDDRAPLPSPDATLASAEALRMPEVERDRQLEAWREAAERLSTTRVESALAVGDPASEIVRFVGAGGFDVVVMGTHGRTGRDRVPFGSVAQKVILDAPCPVLVVNGQVRARAP